MNYHGMRAHLITAGGLVFSNETPPPPAAPSNHCRLGYQRNRLSFIKMAFNVVQSFFMIPHRLYHVRCHAGPIGPAVWWTYCTSGPI